MPAMFQTHFQVLSCSEHDRAPAFKELLSSHVVAMVTQELGAITRDPCMRKQRLRV